MLKQSHFVEPITFQNLIYKTKKYIYQKVVPLWAEDFPNTPGKVFQHKMHQKSFQIVFREVFQSLSKSENPANLKKIKQLQNTEKHQKYNFYV